MSLESGKHTQIHYIEIRISDTAQIKTERTASMFIVQAYAEQKWDNG